MLKNSSSHYGTIAKAVHWLSAGCVIGLFISGLWMVTLNYYDNWYVLAPHYHVSIGFLLFALMIFRVCWRCLNSRPKAPDTHTATEKKVAHWAHIIIYIAIFAILITGYLIPTADNRGIDVFNWFTVPSLGLLFENQADLAGKLHLWIAYGLIGLVVIHALAALKHHFIDKDNTLKRML